MKKITTIMKWFALVGIMFNSFLLTIEIMSPRYFSLFHVFSLIVFVFFSFFWDYMGKNYA